uniref:Ig-like domain-containing protein n=1 Tax=Xenopus tropicalis TaxID=8364 RepID=A0A803JUP9_XENTR
MHLIARLGLCFLFSWVPGGKSEVQLSQDKEMQTVRAGKEVHFQCRVLEGEMEKMWMYWYKKDSNNKLIWIYREGGKYAPGFESLVEGSVKSSLCTLRIKRARITDSGVYYCVISCDL